MTYLNISKLLKGKTPINVSIDRQARAIYFKISDEEVLRTERPNRSLSIDYGKDDNVIGIEIIRVNKIERVIKLAYQDISSLIPRKSLATT